MATKQCAGERLDLGHERRRGSNVLVVEAEAFGPTMDAHREGVSPDGSLKTQPGSPPPDVDKPRLATAGYADTKRGLGQRVLEISVAGEGGRTRWGLTRCEKVPDHTLEPLCELKGVIPGCPGLGD